MTVYLVNILVMLVFAVLLLWHRPDRIKRAVFCSLASVQWILLSGLRHPSVGADTYAYRYDFYRIMGLSWHEVLYQFWGSYFGPLDLKDPGYAVFVKFTQLAVADYQIYLLLVAAIFTIPLGLFIYRHSADPFLSFLVYSTLFYSFFAITGIRQTIATALVVLVGYKFILERRLGPFLLVALVAFFIHKSALVFVPFYFIAHMRIRVSTVLTSVLGALLVFVLRDPIGAFLSQAFLRGDYAQAYPGAGTWTFTVMLGAVFIATLWRARIVLDRNPRALPWLNALLVGVLVTPLTYRNPSAMRVVQYFTLFLMPLIPAIVRSFRDGQERRLAYWAVISLLALLFAQTNPQYQFFWQI